MDIVAKGFSCSAVRLQKYGGSIRSCSETTFEKVYFFFKKWWLIMVVNHNMGITVLPLLFTLGSKPYCFKGIPITSLETVNRSTIFEGSSSAGPFAPKSPVVMGSIFSLEERLRSGVLASKLAAGLRTAWGMMRGSWCLGNSSGEPAAFDLPCLLTHTFRAILQSFKNVSGPAVSKTFEAGWRNFYTFFLWSWLFLVHVHIVRCPVEVVSSSGTAWLSQGFS